MLKPGLPKYVSFTTLNLFAWEILLIRKLEIEKTKSNTLY